MAANWLSNSISRCSFIMLARYSLRPSRFSFDTTRTTLKTRKRGHAVRCRRSRDVVRGGAGVPAGLSGMYGPVPAPHLGHLGSPRCASEAIELAKRSRINHMGRLRWIRTDKRAYVWGVPIPHVRIVSWSGTGPKLLRNGLVGNRAWQVPVAKELPIPGPGNSPTGSRRARILAPISRPAVRPGVAHALVAWAGCGHGRGLTVS